MKPTIPEVRARFLAYYQQPGNSCWGSLHIVLDDGNIADDHVRFCVGFAERNNDPEGAELARILLQMSKTQRRKMYLTPEPQHM